MPFGWDDVALMGVSLLGSLFGSTQGSQNEGGGVSPQDVATSRQNILGPPSGSETYLTGLQQQLAGQGFSGASGQAFGGLPSLADLASGNLPQATLQRIHELAFGGMQQGLGQAMGTADASAMTRGIPISSIHDSLYGSMAGPLIQSANQLQAGLQNQAVDQLGQMRQQALATNIAMQQSPALDQLLKIRLAQAKQNQTQLTRFPGGLPGSAYANFASRR